jgi:GNAT superfamily N-acetyltransferase
VGAEAIGPWVERLRPFKGTIDDLLAGSAQAFLAREGANVLGVTFATRRADGSWFSHDTFVFPDARRGGAGKALLDALARHADGAGLWGEVLAYNRASQNLLTACGWSRVGRVWRAHRVDLRREPVDLPDWRDE